MYSLTCLANYESFRKLPIDVSNDLYYCFIIIHLNDTEILPFVYHHYKIYVSKKYALLFFIYNNNFIKNI